MPLEKLDVGAAVVVRVVPVGAARVIGRDGDLDVVALLRLHGPEDVVGDSAGAHMRTVEMEVRRVEVVRQHHVERHRVGVRRQVVKEADSQRVARPYAQGGSRDRAFVGPERQPVAADILVGIADPQGRPQLSIRRAADLRLEEWRPRRERRPRGAPRARDMVLHRRRERARRVAPRDRQPDKARRQQGRSDRGPPQKAAP